MKKNGAPQRRKGPGILTLAGLGMVLVSLLILLILNLIPGSSANKRNPVLLISGIEENIPGNSLENTLHAVGFDLENDPEGDFVLEDDRNYVILSAGENALNTINIYKDTENVVGFIFLCPAFNSEVLPEGMSSTEPSQDIAIFAGADDASKVLEIGDARAVYERLSGDDTVYGVPVKRGGLFASKVFINNLQTRYLSLSHFKVKDPAKFLFSPLMQNELAGYLSSTYQDLTIRDAGFGRIDSWFVFAVLSIFCCLTGFCLYLAALPLVLSDMKQETIHKGEKASAALIGGISLALCIGVIATTFLDIFRKWAPTVMVLLPLVFMLSMTLSKIRFIAGKEGRFVRRNTRMIRPLFISATVVLLVFFTFNIFFDLKVRNGMPASVLLPAVFLADIILSASLLYADRKSRYMGEGGCSLFGNRVIFLMMLIPSVFAFIFGLVFKMRDIMYGGLSGALCVLLPFVSLVPLRRHTDHSLIPGLVHGIIYVIAVAAML